MAALIPMENCSRNAPEVKTLPRLDPVPRQGQSLPPQGRAPLLANSRHRGVVVSGLTRPEAMTRNPQGFLVISIGSRRLTRNRACPIDSRARRLRAAVASLAGRVMKEVKDAYRGQARDYRAADRRDSV